MTAKGRPALQSRPPDGVRLQLLGGFDLCVDGAAVQLPPGMQRMLALLALHAAPLRRVQVAGTLWPDAPEDSAHARLRSMLWRLGRFRVALVQPHGASLGFAGGAHVDVHELARQARALQGGATGHDDLLSARLVLDDDLLPDWDDDWLLIERERIRQLRLHVLETLAHRLIDAGRAADAVDTALTAVAVEPLRESAQRVLITAHLAQGNQAEAMRRYHAFSRLLHESVGLRPSASMARLMAPLLDA